MKNKLKFFNVTAHRPQNKMDKTSAKNLAVNLRGDDPDIYGFNGGIKGWIIGTLVQHSKKYVKKGNRYIAQFNPIGGVVGK